MGVRWSSRGKSLRGLMRAAGRAGRGCSRSALRHDPAPLLRSPEAAELAYSAPLFDYIVEEGRTSPYRHWFRLNMPHDVQQALATRCGDRNIVVGDYAGIDGSIDYPCTPGLSADTIKAAAGILREDPEALRLLRLRVADVDTGMSNLTLYNATMRDGLRAIAKAAP